MKNSILGWFNSQFGEFGGKKKLARFRGRDVKNSTRDYERLQKQIVEIQILASKTGFEIIARSEWNELEITFKDQEECEYLVRMGWDLIEKGEMTYRTINEKLLQMRDFVKYHNEINEEISLSFDNEKITLKRIES